MVNARDGIKSLTLNPNLLLEFDLTASPDIVSSTCVGLHNCLNLSICVINSGVWQDSSVCTEVVIVKLCRTPHNTQPKIMALPMAGCV